MRISSGAGMFFFFFFGLADCTTTSFIRNTIPREMRIVCWRRTTQFEMMKKKA